MWRLRGVWQKIEEEEEEGGGAGQSEGGRTSGDSGFSSSKEANNQSCVSAKKEEDNCTAGYDWTGARVEAGSNCGASWPSFIVDRSLVRAL